MITASKQYENPNPFNWEPEPQRSTPAWVWWLLADDGGLVDTIREESQILTFEQLWAARGRRAVRAFKRMYGVSRVELPSQIGKRRARS